MAKKQKPIADGPSEPVTDRIARDDAIAERYQGRPSLRKLYENGQIDRRAYERAERLHAAGPPARPLQDLITALRAERERQRLSLGDVAQRTGMDRAAIHKLEIGLNANPTVATLSRYASALGARIEWDLKTNDARKPAKA